MRVLWLASCILFAVAYGGSAWIEIAEFKGGTRRPQDVQLFSTPERFSYYPIDLFKTLGDDRLQALVDHFINSGKIGQFASRIRDEDVLFLLKRDDDARIKTLVPLLNVFPDAKMRFIRHAHLHALLTKSAGKNGSNQLKVERIALVPINALRENGWSALRGLDDYIEHLAVKAFAAVCTDGYCEIFNGRALSQMPIEKAGHLNANCMNKIAKKGMLTVPDKVVAALPEDAFSLVPADAIPTSIYQIMTAKQLSFNLLQTTPSEEILQSIPGKVLNQALQHMQEKPQRCYSVSPDLVSNLPKGVFQSLGEKFWENINHHNIWTIKSSQLLELPQRAFAAIHPAILSTLEIIIEDQVCQRDVRVGLLLKNLGTRKRLDGKHPCQTPSHFFAFIHPYLFKYLQPECAKEMDYAFAHLFSSYDHLNALTRTTIESLEMNHVANIPPSAFSGPIRPFIKAINEISIARFAKGDMDKVPCAGLGSDQLAEIKVGGIWQIFSMECFLAWSNYTQSCIPAEYFRFLQVDIFKRLYFLESDASLDTREVLNTIFEKIAPIQMENLAASFDSEPDLHPCFELDISWGRIGGGMHLQVVSKMPPSCFALLYKGLYQGMGDGVIARMSEDIFRYFTDEERFAAIPGEALRGMKPSQMLHLKPALFSGLTSAQLDVLTADGNTKHISSEAWANVSKELLIHAIALKAPMSQSALALVSIDLLRDSKWISQHGDNLSVPQWNTFAIENPQREHFLICGNVKYEDVELSSGKNRCLNFWKGINAECMATLSFLERLTMAELTLVPDAAFATLDTGQRGILGKILGEGQWRLEMGSGCSKYTISYIKSMKDYHFPLISATCFSQLQAEVIKEFPPNIIPQLTLLLFQKISPEQTRALSLPAIRAIREEQWGEFGAGLLGVSCIGFSAEQTPALPLKDVPPFCIGFMQGEVFGTFLPHHLEAIPTEAWEAFISKDQIEAIPESSIANFSKLDHLGLKWKWSKALHPCLGITEAHKKLMSPESQSKYYSACATIGKTNNARGFLESMGPILAKWTALVVGYGLLIY